VEHPGYLKFCKDLFKKYECDTVVFIGDVVDWHAISFHAKQPECPGMLDEYKMTKKRIKKWYRTFPSAQVCIGNHDQRPERVANSVGIASVLLRTYNEIWDTPSWVWDFNFIIDGVYYCHGTGKGGYHPAYNKARNMGMPVVMGHCHARAGYKWLVNPLRRWFGMDTGCGIDNDAFQFVYGKNNDDKPIVAAGIICDAFPQHFIMPMTRGEKFHKSKFRG
jgi:hypothetical protein